MSGRRWRPVPALVVIACIGAALPATAHARSKNPCFALLSEPSSPGPVAETSPLDPAVTSMFAVLRRPAGPEDQIPLFNPLSEAIGDQLRSYLPAYIRQLTRDSEGDRYFLIVGFEQSGPIPPAKCLPPDIRRHYAQFVAEAHRRETQPVYCIEDIGSHHSGYVESGCQPFASVQSGARLISTDESTSDVIELVPDGVATVRLIYLRGSVVTAPVSANTLSFTPPQRPITEAQRRLRPLRKEIAKQFRAHHQTAFSQLVRRFTKLAAEIVRRLRPQTVEWIGAGGQVVRSFRPKAEGLVGTSGRALVPITISG